MIPTVISLPNPPGRRLYFDNNAVEDLLTQYHWTGCTDVGLRNAIMAHSTELICKVIRLHGLAKIGPATDRTTEELESIAWVQIEATLYKYRARPHCRDCYNPNNPSTSALHPADHYGYRILTPKQVSDLELTCPRCKQKPDTLVYRGTTKIFNMWNQVARTSLLAHIKRESRDARYRKVTGEWMGIRNPQHEETPDPCGLLERLLTGLEEEFKHNTTNLRIIDAIRQLPSTGKIIRVLNGAGGIGPRLVQISGQSRCDVERFLVVARAMQQVDR